MIPIKDDNPTFSTPYVTVGLIIINCLVYLYQLSLGAYGQAFVLQTGAIPAELTSFSRLSPLTAASPVPLYLTPLTSMFVHGGFFHVGFNMLYLWIFGNNVEDRFGHLSFFLFYILCGISAAMIYALTDINSNAPMVGASGAIAGVLGAYLIMFPKAKIVTLVILIIFITIVRIPAVVFLGLWFFIQILNAKSGAGNVAWYAHLGGFMAGLILTGIWAGKRFSLHRRPARYKYH